MKSTLVHLFQDEALDLTLPARLVFGERPPVLLRTHDQVSVRKRKGGGGGGGFGRLVLGDLVAHNCHIYVPQDAVFALKVACCVH